MSTCTEDRDESSLSRDEVAYITAIIQRTERAIRENDIKILKRQLISMALKRPTPRRLIRVGIRASIANKNFESFVLFFNEFVKQREAFYNHIESTAGTEEERAVRAVDDQQKERDHDFETWLSIYFRTAQKDGLQEVVGHILRHVQDAQYGLVLDKVYDVRPGCTKSETLVKLMFASIDHNDQHTAREILRENFQFKAITGILEYVWRRKLTAFIPMVIDNILLPNKGGLLMLEQVVTHNFGLREHPVARPIEARRMLTIEPPLKEALEEKWDEGINLLLPAYIQCLADVDRGNSQDYNANILSLATVDHLVHAMTRPQAISYLDVDLPPIARRAVFRRLQVPDGGDGGMIEIKCGETKFSAQQDLLCYWSGYFQGRTRHGWLDSSAVDFGDDIDPEIMSAILAFVYTGEYDYQGDQAGRFNFLVYLGKVSDYLLIDRLLVRAQALMGPRLMPAAYGVPDRFRNFT
ncbi:BTB/POZ domain-containing protein [Aspergillus mulundensis]|uniref:BTB domain-containing protein n=1 Tax=Aspergillus mulundensis TaxID=1810919 RepID=A0A3D8SLC5_9EURO|nr:hypothetical protein DSM5745_03704 [Aspergillus mulundensis]RDW87062.1 hypothetical protein DSM5745_03704 [Aspergillus mulundensis]